MNYKNLFEELYDDFMKTDMKRDMLLTREDSPWHRESSVMEHTRMCLAWYKNNLASSRTEFQQYLTKIAIMFHDTGKPMARTEKHSESRGTYFAYPGHEQISAMKFMDYVCKKKAEGFEPISILHDFDITFIRYMIQFHLPFDFNQAKLENIKKPMVWHSLRNEYQCFTDLILSDAHGRISDDMESKLQKVDKWINDFKNIECQLNLDDYLNRANSETVPSLIIMIGASGSGKSTYIKNNIRENEHHFGLDLMRERFYIQDFNQTAEYNQYFQYADENSTRFNQLVQKEFNALVKTNQTIFIDNTNISAKSRRQWIEEAKKHNYRIQAVELISPFEVNLARQQTRNDKTVSRHIVEKQYFNVALPLEYSEVDEYKLYMNVNNEIF